MVAAELVGIAIGGILPSRIAKGRRWYRVLIPAGFAMAILTASVSIVPLLPVSITLYVLLVILGLLGVAGGLFMIPCESFIQIRPAPDRKGTVIAASNCAIFMGILLSGLTANLLNEYLQPTASFLVMSALALVVSVWLWVYLGGENRRT